MIAHAWFLLAKNLHVLYFAWYFCRLMKFYSLFLFAVCFSHSIIFCICATSKFKQTKVQKLTDIRDRLGLAIDNYSLPLDCTISDRALNTIDIHINMAKLRIQCTPSMCASSSVSFH